MNIDKFLKANLPSRPGMDPGGPAHSRFHLRSSHTLQIKVTLMKSRREVQSVWRSCSCISYTNITRDGTFKCRRFSLSSHFKRNYSNVLQSNLLKRTAKNPSGNKLLYNYGDWCSSQGTSFKLSVTKHRLQQVSWFRIKSNFLVMSKCLEKLSTNEI